MDVKDGSTFVQGTATLKNKRRHTYHYVDQPAAGKGLAAKATCVLLHGFPDLWYGWRYQIKALSSQGYRVICPSQLGYAGSSQPDDLQAYTYRNLAEDLNELLDVLNAGEQILLFGHDWYAAPRSVCDRFRKARSDCILLHTGAVFWPGALPTTTHSVCEP